MAAAVEPTLSNMGYITTVLEHEQRLAGGLKNGALAAATVAIDPHGGVTVTADSIPQGQGHRTVLAEVVAGAFGLAPRDIRVVAEFDSARDAWSIAAGNYSCRFAPAVAGTAWRAAGRLRDRLARLAAARLDLPLEDIRFEGGMVGAGPDKEMRFARLAGLAHWSPGTLPQGVEPALRATEFWSPPELGPPDAEDRINGSAAYGFIFDACSVEVDADTGRVRIDRYVTAHDAGCLLHRPMADGQVRGGLSNAVGAALFEAFVYDEAGQPLAGTFADYPPPTACEAPDPEILHLETPSPLHPARRQGHRRGQRHERAPLHRQCGGGRARRRRSGTAAHARPRRGAHPVKPAPFDYLRPASLDEALEALVSDGAMALAGGQSLVAMLNMRLARPDLLVDIMRLPELRERGTRIGAAVRQAELAGLHPLIDRAPAACRALPDPQPGHLLRLGRAWRPGGGTAALPCGARRAGSISPRRAASGRSRPRTSSRGR